MGKNSKIYSHVYGYLKTIDFILRNCQILALMSRKFNMDCVEIHSLMKQRLRMASLANFKSSQAKILFATDVASR